MMDSLWRMRCVMFEVISSLSGQLLQMQNARGGVVNEATYLSH